MFSFPFGHFALFKRKLQMQKRSLRLFICELHSVIRKLQSKNLIRQA